jgi:hypothetical protein
MHAILAGTALTFPLRFLAAVAGTRAAVPGRATKITTIKTT